MTAADLIRHIRERNSFARSAEEHPPVALEMINAEIDPRHEGLRDAEIEELLRFELDYNIDTTVGHLADCGVLEVIQPNRTTPYVISERLDEIVNGQVDEVVDEDIELLINHIQDSDDSFESADGEAVADGGTDSLRDRLADEFDIFADSLETFLRNGNQVEKLNTAIDVIEESDEFERLGDFGRILFRFPARRYRVSNFAMQTYES